jgi:hypothetical protein
MKAKHAVFGACCAALVVCSWLGCGEPCPPFYRPPPMTSSGGVGGQDPGASVSGSGGYDPTDFPWCGNHYVTLRGTLNGLAIDDGWDADDREWELDSVPMVMRIPFESRYGVLPDSRIDLKWYGEPGPDHWVPLFGLMLLPDDPKIYRFKPGSKLFISEESELSFELVMDEGHLFGCTQ